MADIISEQLHTDLYSDVLLLRIVCLIPLVNDLILDISGFMV